IKGQIINSQQQTEKAYFDYDLKQLSDQMLGYHTGSLSLNSNHLSIFNKDYSYELVSIYFEDSTKIPDVNKWLIESDRNDLSAYIKNEESNLGLLLLFFPSNRSIEEYRISRPVIEPLFSWLNSENIGCAIGISSVHDSLTTLREAFLEACQALDYQHLNITENQLFYYKESIAPHRIHWDSQDEFLFRLEAGMSTEMQALLEDLFAMYEANEAAMLLDLKYHCRKLSEECNKVVSYYMDSSEQVQSSSSMQQIVDQIFSKNELFNYYKIFFSNLTLLLTAKSVYSTGDNISKIQTYIQRNYQKNITQELLASYFYINRSYLSTLFKERTGEKFVDYLNSIRIDKSKELLANSNLKMYQIAKNVGYDNVKYFFRIFRKKVGMTPEAYREDSKTEVSP
ncbi:MAG: helix-turn-helix domain-containing protein, partial [Pseudobutyrivibrio sp.]|nr:helix-turn-helix domain-containing protein [Pseudobutyrivibrio sp.]